MEARTPAHLWQTAIVLLGALGCMLLYRTSATAAAVTPTQIAQVPLTVAVPAHPQLVLVVGNSESMDGNVSGAIMAGSGLINSPALSLLQNSSSPAAYTIPAGFTPPIDPGNGVTAPYTSPVGSLQVDNSPSRLNVAKGGILAMLNTYMPYADFALIDYKLSGTNVYTTWVYETSPASGFVFTSASVAPNRYVPNPCLNYTSLTTTNSVYVACHAIDTSGQVHGNMATSTLMQIDASIFPAGGAYNGGSSDDPLINDVLYAGGLAPVCLVYGGPFPGNPYTHFTLAPYNANPGSISESYSHTISACAPTTFPTTYQPNVSQCIGSGAAWLMVLNYATGGSFPLAELDTNADEKLDSNDMGSTGSAPVGMSLGPVYASAVTFLPTSNGSTMKLTSVSSNNVDSIMDRGRAKERISWWEVRH